jgi:hypothetical protein
MLISFKDVLKPTYGHFGEVLSLWLVLGYMHLWEDDLIGCFILDGEMKETDNVALVFIVRRLP